MNWSQVFALKGWLSLRTLSTPPQRLDADVVKLGDNMYAPAVPYNELLDTEDPGVPYAGLVLWASSDGAARRALEMDIESDDQVEGVLPPADLAVHLHGNTYGEIKARAALARAEPNEHAAYRIARDGAFVHKSVDVNNVTYYFRGRRAKSKERPFAIAIRLPSARARR